MARPDQVSLAETQQIQLPETEIPQTEEHSQVEIFNNSEYTYSQTSNHTPIHIRPVQVFVIVSLTVRVITLLCLLVSLIVLVSNTTNIQVLFPDGFIRDVEFDFNNVYSYRYMLSAIVISFAYTCVQIPLEIYQLATGKSLIAMGTWLPKIIFYSDKFLLPLLATSVGAAFGATLDSKKIIDRLDDHFESLGNPIFYDLRTKLDNFYNLGYVPGGFLLIAFLCSVASSILSSLALQKK